MKGIIYILLYRFSIPDAACFPLPPAPTASLPLRVFALPLASLSQPPLFRMEQEYI